MRNTTTYTAKFKLLRMHAFGKEQSLSYEGYVTLYQARDCPELWRARPFFSRGTHLWEHYDPNELAALIESDFEFQLTPWMEHHPQGSRFVERPLQPTIPIDMNRRRA